MGKKLTVPAKVTDVFGTCQKQEHVDRRVTVMCLSLRWPCNVHKSSHFDIGKFCYLSPYTFPVNVTTLAYHFKFWTAFDESNALGIVIP